LEVCISEPKVKKMTEKTLIGMAFRAPLLYVIDIMGMSLVAPAAC